MPARIRYRKIHDSGKYVSVGIFPGPMGEGFQVHLNSTTATFEITDLNCSNQVIAGGQGVSMANLKIKAKKALESLGIVFEDEKRIKKNVVEV
jgi:hypothetical protein